MQQQEEQRFSSSDICSSQLHGSGSVHVPFSCLLFTLSLLGAVITHPASSSASETNLRLVSTCPSLVARCRPSIRPDSPPRPRWSGASSSRPHAPHFHFVSERLGSRRAGASLSCSLADLAYKWKKEKRGEKRSNQRQFKE